MEGWLKKELSVEVFKLKAAQKQKLYGFKEAASQSAIRDDLGIIVASVYGCCGGTDAHAVRSLKNGTRLFFASGDRSPYILNVSWPNTDRAWLVGVHVSGSERDDEIYKDLPKQKRGRRILMSMASTTKLFDQVAMVFGDVDVSPRVEAVEWVGGKDMKVYERQLEVWPPTGGQPAPIPSVRIRVTGGRTILVPLDGDHFGKITAPEDVTTVHLPPVH